jgi:hypothetical protein
VIYDTKKFVLAVGAFILGIGLVCAAAALERNSWAPNDHQPATPVVAKRVVEAIISNSTSDQDQKDSLHSRLERIAALARQTQATVEVFAGTGATDTEVRMIGRANFSTGSDNPEATLPPHTYDNFMAETIAGLARLAPATTTDVPGALRLLGRRAVELRAQGVKAITAYLIGDSVSTSPECDLQLAATDPSTWSATATSCIKDSQPSLRGIDVVLVGAGQDTTGRLDPAVGRAAVGITEAMVTLCGGKPRTETIE